VSSGVPGAIAQLGERPLCKREVIGSIPIGSTEMRSPRTCPVWTVRGLFRFVGRIVSPALVAAIGLPCVEDLLSKQSMEGGVEVCRCASMHGRGLEDVGARRGEPMKPL